MRLVPTHCDACLHSSLVETGAVVDGSAPCPTCAATARTLPGESYASHDVALFNDLEATLREAQLTPLNAVQLAVELEARTSAPGRGLKRLAQLLPSLSILELIVSNDPGVMRKAEGMLATLLEAIAASRSKSGVMKAIRPPHPAKTGND